jgi:hypothetical protein
LSTTNPTWNDLGASLGLCGKRPATNRLRYGTATSILNDETFFYPIYGISFSQNYRAETQNRLLNDLTGTETQIELKTDLTSRLHVHYIRGKHKKT